MKLAIASGKGGTGKSMVAANLAFTLSRTEQVTLVDCDVEEPNLHLFFPTPAIVTEVTVPVPVVDENTCQHCGLCGEFCQYGAMTVLSDRVLFFPELCHSCGGCMLVCPNDAIHEKQKRIGTVAISRPLPNLKLISGMLDTGNPHAVPVIGAAKQKAAGDPMVICDSAPGTSCPVVETMDGCDVCILVTESTPFGLHDLRLAVDVAGRLGIPTGIVINRSDGKDQAVIDFCRAQDLEVMMTIPFDREIAAIQSRGNLLCQVLPTWQNKFTGLFMKCRALCKVDR
jgi:MinD superfamily P-loop ATPase